MEFKKAERKKLKLRLAIEGPSGSGKTYTSLRLAKGLGGRNAVIDTEQESSSLYSHKFDFDSLRLDEYSPDHYVQAIKLAESMGYDVLIIDSITPEWSGAGGILELNEQIAKKRFGGNTWSAWSVTTPMHRKFIDTILQCNMHVIVTMRSKTETSQIKDERTNKMKVVKLGMKAEQKDGMEYEFTCVLSLTHDGHYAIPSKDRTELFDPVNPILITEETGVRLREWLETGKSFDDNLIKDKEDLCAELINQINSSDTMEELDEVRIKVQQVASSLSKEQIVELRLARDLKLKEIEDKKRMENTDD